MAKTCKIIRNQNGSPIGVADSNGNPSRVFKQILQIPFLRNFDEAVNTYTYLKGEIPTLDEVTQQLQKTGLAKKVHTLSPQQIEQELIRRGVDSNVAKQVSAWHGSPHLFNRFSLSAIGTGEGAQAFGWGLYFTDLESIAREYANDLTSIAQERYGFFEFLDDNLDDFDYYANELAYLGVNERGEDAIAQLEEVLAQNREEIRDLNGSTDINDVEYVTHLQNQVAIAEKLIADAKQYLADLPSRNLYKVTLHKGKTPDQYTWLEWDKSVPKTIMDAVYNGFVEREGQSVGLGDPKDGQQLYDALKDILGSQKEASLFLLRAGIDGIKYPAESISRGATSDTARGFNYVVFDENAITIEEVIQFQKAGLGLLPNGFVDLNTKEVFLNQETANLDTPIHEFSHLFTDILKQTNPQLYQRGLELIEKEGKEYIDFVKKNQPNLEGEALLEEALTQAVGEAGEKIINKQSSFFQWLQDMWNSLKDMIGLTQYSWNEVKDMNLQQFTEAMAVDLLRGEELRPSPILSTEQELEQIKAQAIADGTFMKAPNGKPTNLTERQWLQVRSKAFKDWFGDWINDPENASKVVDENGEPLVVYHGTDGNFTEFKKIEGSNRKSKMQLLFGNHFATLKKDAELYTKIGNVFNSFLNSKTPIDLSVGYISKNDKNFEKWLQIVNELNLVKKNKNTFDYTLFTENGDYGGKSNEIERIFINAKILDEIAPNKVYTALLNAGFDGVIYVPYQPQGFNQYTEFSKSYITFSPNQIKSATDNIGTFSAQSSDIRYQVTGEQNAGLTPNRDVQVYITPATIRNFNEETLRLKELTNEYNNVAKEISQGNLENQEEFTNLQHRILDAYQEHIQDKVSKIRGVNVSFNQPYLGSWGGNYEPSLNMTLSISPNADTGAISGLLFDIAENTSQDAFILEERSEIEDRTPLTEFDEAGMMHYPQFRVIFDRQLSVAEKSIIAQRLKNKGVEEFSIDGDYFIVSIIDFNSETNEQKEKYYAEKAAAITSLFTGEGEKIGTNRVRDVQKHIRKSKYVGARNEGDEQSQTREYDRSDLFETQSQNISSQATGEQDVQILNQESKAFNEGIEAVAKLADEYKKEFGIDSVRHNKVVKLYPTVSKMIAEAYEQAEAGMTTEEVKEAYKALEEETLQQYKFIVDKGLKVSRWTGEGEPYPNSKSMLIDVRENNHLYFLPNSEAFGKEGDDVEGRVGLKLTDVYLEDGYRMTLSEVFRVVHDYFGHGILGNQFGAIGEENATLQHLDLYSSKALPAVIFQTRGQNSWVNFSGVNDEALRKIKEGSKTNDENLLKEGQKEFRFATPKDNILPKIFNFKTYETARRIHEQEEIRKSETYLDPRGTYEDNDISELLTRHTLRNGGKLNGFSRRSLGRTQVLGDHTVTVVAEYLADNNTESLIKKAFPNFKGAQKIYEITDGEVYRELMIKALETNKYKSSVTVHSAEDFSKMRLFVTEDGSTGITLTKEGFLGGGFSDPRVNRPNNLAQMLLLGIKEGALTAEAFDTVLPNYYSMFGFKAVSRTAFNDDYRPLKKNGALEDWDYKLYSRFNNGRPDIVFFIYDGGDRGSIQNRLGQFDSYSNYQKDFTEYYDKNSYDDAYRFMEVEAVNKSNHQNQEVSFQINATEQGTQNLDQAEDVPNNVSLQFRDKDGNVYNSLKEMFDNNVEDFKIGIEHEGKFVSAIEAQINPNPQTVNGLIMSLIKDGLISDKATMDTNGEILLVPTGESDLKKAITSDMARGVAKGYHGNIFKIGKDFNIRIAEQEKAKDSHDKTFQQLKREVGEEEALARKTMQEYNKFIGESNRGTTNLDFSLLPDNELVTKLLAYLNKIGVQTTSIEQYVKQYKLKNGVHPDAQALADLSNNIVAFKDGIITEAELIEEVSHFIVDAMNPQERSNMMSNIHRTREWGEYAQTYYDVYSQQGLSGQALEDAVREEILGKVLANSLKENFQRAQEQTIEGGIVSRLMEAFQEFFQRIKNFFQDSYQAELERYTFNVYENLMNETLPSEQRQRGESKLTLYSTNTVTPLQKATKSWLETLNATQRELKGKYKLSSSSNTLARQIRNLQGEINDATYKNAVADLLSVTNSQINLVDREVTRALKEGTYFPQEIKGAYESIRTSLFPIISQVKGRLGEKDTQLKKEIEKTVQNISDLIDKVPQVNRKALDNILERVFRQNNFTQEEADKYREQVEKVLKSAEYDTSWFHAHLGGLLQARNPLLNLLGDVIEQMKFRERQLLQPVLKTLMSKLEASGFDILQLKKLIYKNEIINEVDPDKVKKLENSIKAKYYNQFVLEGERATEETVEDKISKIQDEINKLTNEIENESKLFTVDEINLKQAQRTEKTLILSQIDKAFRKDLNKQKFISMIDPKYLEDRDKFAIEVNGQIISREKGIIPGIAPEETQVYIDEFNQLSRQIWEIKSLADGGALTKSEQKEIRDIEARRRQLMNPRQLDGTLKPGVVETWSVVKNLKDSTESKVFTYSFDPNMTYDGSTEVSIEQRAEALRIVAFQNLTLLSQKFSASQKGERNGIPQEFIDSLNSLQTEQEKWDFLMNNSTISFPQEFWDSFDPNESLVARLIALKNGDNDVEIDKVVNRIRSNQAKISNIIKSNRDFFNPAETNVEDFFQQTEVKDAQTELDKAKSDARKFFPEGTQFESSEGVDITVNESYLKQLSDLGITNSGKELSSEVDAEFNFARKHMTPRSEDAIISLRNIIKRLKNGETVSKSYFTEQVIGSRTDYDNILREEIRKRLLPYYKRTEPSGYSQALEQLKQGVENNTPNAVLNFMESGLVDVKPSNAFYDTTSRLNPEWVANRDAGREQYTSDYLKKVRNDEYFNRYNPDKDGNATTNIAEFKAREAWLEANDQAIEMYGLTGLMSRYQIPQQHKTVIRRLITSKGKPKAIGEILRDATTIREDDMELGQNIFGEKARKGDAFLTVPRYGVNKLKNQEDVSDEILHSLVWFTQQAALYKARKESISEALALRDFIINTEDYAGKSYKASNTYKMANSFINANFYGVKETFSYEMDIPFLGKIDVGKIARTFNSWVRFSNLAGVTVPLTSMFQGKIQEAIEAIAKESTSPTAYKLAQNKVRKLMSGAAGEIMGFHSKSELNSKLEILGVYNMLDRFNNSALNKGWRTVLAANNGLHQLGNAPVTSTAAFSIVLDYRVVDGRIMTERQYKSIFKNAKDWETYPLFDNFWKIDENGNSKIDKDGLKKALNITNEQEVDRIANDTLESISKRALALVQRVDTQIPEHQKSLASRNAIANFFLMHMNWFLVAIPNKTKFKHNNLSEGGMVQEGNWRTVLNMVSKMVQNPKQIREIWNDVKTDDVQKRALRRFTVEASVANALAVAAIMLANAVDDDDDPAYLLTWADYMLTRVSVEQVSGTIALPQQVDNILESPIVAYQKFKDLRELPNLVFGSGEITQGYYSGYTERQRAAMKTLPYFKEIRRFRDFTRERQMYAHFNLNEDKIFSRYAWLSNLAMEELEDE